MCPHEMEMLLQAAVLGALTLLWVLPAGSPPPQVLTGEIPRALAGRRGESSLQNMPRHFSTTKEDPAKMALQSFWNILPIEGNGFLPLKPP